MNLYLIKNIDIYQLGYELSIVTEEKLDKMWEYEEENPKSKGWFYIVKKIELEQEEYQDILSGCYDLDRYGMATFQNYKQRRLTDAEVKAIFVTEEVEAYDPPKNHYPDLLGRIVHNAMADSGMRPYEEQSDEYKNEMYRIGRKIAKWLLFGEKK